MSLTKRNFLASGAVLVSLVVLLGGNYRRSLVDLGGVQDVGQVDAGTGKVSRDLLVSKSTQIPETNYFESVAELLKSEYVDPVTDDKKLVAGAHQRGMKGGAQQRDMDEIIEVAGLE